MSILKIDVDIDMDNELLLKFVRTRIAILEELGYKVKKINWGKTRRGYHFWIRIDKELTDKEICDLQFLLGDDQMRCRFNYLRLEAGCFEEFNILFSEKF